MLSEGNDIFKSSSDFSKYVFLWVHNYGLLKNIQFGL